VVSPRERVLFGGAISQSLSTSPRPYTSNPKHGGPAGTFPEKVCFYCKKPGHIVAECPVLSNKQKNVTTVALVKTIGRTPMPRLEGEGDGIKDGDNELAGSSSFMMDGFVSLTDAPESRQAIKIWRDTGAFQSLILGGVLPVSEKSALHSSAIVQGFGGGFVNTLLHNVTLTSALVSDNVAVGVCSHIPIKGVSFILGNDLAGGRVLATPEVIPIPVVSEVPDELAQKHPGVCPVCAVTQAREENDKSDSHVDDSNGDSTLSDHGEELKSDHGEKFGKMLPSHEQLVLEQNKVVIVIPLGEGCFRGCNDRRVSWRCC